ncbi:MAG TPA: SusC/RagA family TonB-linked outer membrane protein [Puia sp.]|jgi:TonB-linked SusC/RagA family outer membrane protein|nr:SusC/RagA family TonB-linked outer membrane protein [Puia sp.]
MTKFLSLFAVLVLYSFLASAQLRTITGRITDQQNQPVPFATVKVKGSKQGTAADADGGFTLKVKSGDVLVISGTGVTTQEIPVGDQVRLSIQVKAKENNLTEVVVTALGIQKQEKELGYATAKVTAKDLEIAAPVSVANGLTGKVSGLNIQTTNNGLFAPTRITLRGNRSLTGNNQPLIVVDGAIFYNDISTLNPDDIADITVLKGSSASAVYGSDASNGVLLITTKHGTRNHPSINVSTTQSLEEVDYLPSYQTQFGNNGGEVWVYDFNNLNSYIPFENQSYGPAYNGWMVPLGRPLADSSLLVIPYSAVKNQKKDFFNKAHNTQYNFSYSSGDDNGRFYVSAQHSSQNGVMPYDNGRRDAFRVAGSKNYGVFSANYTLSYTYKYSNQGNTGSIYDDVMASPANVPLASLKNWQTYKYATTDGYFNDYFYNPYMIAATQRNYTTDNNLTGNVQLSLRPTKWFNLSYRLSMNNLSRKYEYTTEEEDYSKYSLNSTVAIFVNPNGSFDTIPGYGTKWIANNNGLTAPTYNTFNYSNFLVTSDFIAGFDYDLGKDFNLKGTLGTTYIDNRITEVGINAGPLFFPVYNVQNLTGIPSLSGQNFFEEARRLGLFGEATIGFKNLAFLHGSYRSDIDSRLSKTNRFIPYYDVDGSVVLSDIFPAIANGKFLDYVKARGAYSVTGNASALAGGSQNIADGAYATVPTLLPASGYGFPYSSVGGYVLSTSIANPNIKPETVKEEEVGLEFGFLKSRFNLQVTAYEQHLSNGIVYAQIPRSSGFDQALLNAAQTKNQGIEVDLHGQVIKTHDWGWMVGVNYTYYHSVVESINANTPSLNISGGNYGFNGVATGAIFAIVGQAYPSIETNDWVRDPSNGKVIVNPTTGNPSISSTFVPEGNATPKDIIGITSTVNYKNWTFSVTADYRGGYKIYNAIGQFMDFSGISSETVQAGRQPFVFPNSEYSTDGGKTYVPNKTLTTNDGNFNFWPGTFDEVGSNYVISGDVWKIREMSLSFSFPKKMLSSMKVVQGITAGISGRNLFMFRPKINKWTDPEFSDTTGNGVGVTTENEAPPTRIFNATLGITF